MTKQEFEAVAKEYANNLDPDNYIPAPKINDAPWQTVIAFAYQRDKLFGHPGATAIDIDSGDEFAIDTIFDDWASFLDDTYCLPENKAPRKLVLEYWQDVRLEMDAERAL